jgi:hypothetical protein
MKSVSYESLFETSFLFTSVVSRTVPEAFHAIKHIAFPIHHRETPQMIPGGVGSKSAKTVMNAADQQAWKGRDQIGLIQNSLQYLLHLMVDAIGRIQRDAAIDPAAIPPDANRLYKYEEIPDQAREIVRTVMQVDALIDEAIDQTIIGKDESEIFEILKKESDTFVANVEPLVERARDADVWIARSAEILDLIASNALGLQPDEAQAEEDSVD